MQERKFDAKKWERNFETEEQFQARSFMMISQEFPELRDLVWHTRNESSWTPLPNETKEDFNKRTMIWGNKNKALGVLAGVMDLLCYRKGIFYRNELKLPKGQLNDAQKKLHLLWNKQHPENPCWISRSMEDVWNWCIYILSEPFVVLENPFREEK